MFPNQLTFHLRLSSIMHTDLSFLTMKINAVYTVTLFIDWTITFCLYFTTSCYHRNSVEVSHTVIQEMT